MVSATERSQAAGMVAAAFSGSLQVKIGLSLFPRQDEFTKPLTVLPKISWQEVCEASRPQEGETTTADPDDNPFDLDWQGPDAIKSCVVTEASLNSPRVSASAELLC